MSPFGRHPPHLVDNTDTMYLGGPALITDIVGFFEDLCFCVELFVFMSVSFFCFSAIYSQVF